MIGYLYSTVGIVVIFSYMPQILKLIRAKTSCDEISLASWWIWNYTTTVTLLYAWIDISDVKLTIVTLINFICVNIVICLTLYKRQKYRKKGEESITPSQLS